MRIDAAFPSKYLKAADLQDRKVTVAMSRVELEDIGDGDPKAVLYFQGKEKGLVLNRTNANMIETLYGPETDDWVGQQITLYPATTDFRGKTVPCIRVSAAPPSKKTVEQPPAQPKKETLPHYDPDDPNSIPF